VICLYFGFFLCVKESDLHTKRTGHTEFSDKTSEAAKPISLEVPKEAAGSEQATDASTSQPEGTISVHCFSYFVTEFDLNVEINFLSLFDLLHYVLVSIFLDYVLVSIFLV
jgi:hypothetical protein